MYDMEKRKRMALTVDMEPTPDLKKELEREAEEYSKKVGVKVSLGAYVRRLLETHPDRKKKR